MHNNDELLTFKIIAEGTSSVVGKDFFKELVKHLAEALNVSGAWVTEIMDNGQRLRALAKWLNGEYIDDFEFEMKGTPCEVVIEHPGGIYHVPDKIVQLFPNDAALVKMDAVSYMGMLKVEIKERTNEHIEIASAYLVNCKRALIINILKRGNQMRALS